MILRGARVVDPRSPIDELRDVFVREGEIAELATAGRAALEGAEEIDCDGLLACPAFFDPHVHLRVPGGEDAEDLETGTRAAAAGGYGGIVAMANTQPPVDTPEAILALREQARQQARVPVGFVATVTRRMLGEELTDMAAIADAGAVGYSDDGLPIANGALLRNALRYQAICGGNIALHEEDPQLSSGGSMHEGIVSAELGVAPIPASSESSMIARDGQIVAEAGGRAHVQHLSAARSVEALEAARAAGANLTGEVSPHHLTLTENAVRSLDSRFKMNPPLRSDADRLALIDALRRGALPYIATDHAPHPDRAKDVPFEEAAFGVTGLETAFAILNTELVEPGHLELATLIERMTAPAELFDLEIGRIGARRRGEHRTDRSRQGVGGGGDRLGEPVLQLLLHRAAAARQGRDHDHRRQGRLPRADLGDRTGMNREAGYILLEDGERFDGELCGAAAPACGEIVFNTAMTGYQESVTDPSYAGQIITFTYPLVGNYGVSGSAMESDRAHARAVVMREAKNGEDAADAEGGWIDWLEMTGVTAISGVDTRALVRHIRDRGAMRAGIFTAKTAEDEAGDRILGEPSMAGADLARTVTPGAAIEFDGDGPHVVGIDTGIKLSIIRQLRERNCRLTLLPCTADADSVLAHNPDLVFLANGPGDPAALGYVVETVREIVGKAPIFGICLGHQLLCRAVGLETYKLPFGHRGANHPVKDLRTGKIDITSQNHGFAVRPPGEALTIESDEPVRWETDFGGASLTHLNLYDRTVEGLALHDVPAATVQYHPEAGPGPHDARYLFDEFLELANA